MLDPASISMIAALVILVILSAFFSATETAFTSLNRIRLKSRADSGNKRAALTLRIAEDYDKLLSTNLIGNNIVNISASTVGTVLFTKLFLDYGPLVSTVVLTVVILVFGEISPKSMAKENAEAFAMFAAPIMRVLMTVLAPVNYLFAQWKKLLSRIFRKSEEEGITEEELITMVDQAENEGGLDQHEGQLIRSAIEFNDLEVEEILTPRVDIVAAEDTATMDEIAAIFAENGYSRLPIYHDTIDNIIGVIHEKDFHAATTARRTYPPSSAMCSTPPAAPRSPTCCASSSGPRPTWSLWWTSTAAPKACAPWRTSSRSWWAKSGMSTTRSSRSSKSSPTAAT